MLGPLVFGDFELDPAGELRRAGGVVKLPPLAGR